MDERTELMRSLNEELTDDEMSEKKLQEIATKIRKFSYEYRFSEKLRIDPEDLDKSYTNFLRNNAMSYKGALIDKNDAKDTMEVLLGRSLTTADEEDEE
jgi:hypothetical protein